MHLSMLRGISPLTIVVAALLLLLIQPCGAANLLQNPGFELGAPLAQGYGPWSTVNNGWTYEFPDSNTGNQSGVDRESNAGLYWGVPPTFHTGSEALRTYQILGVALVEAYQKVAVQPNASYQASVYVRTVGSFGSTSGDFAGLIIRQLDANGLDIAGSTQQVGLTDAATEDYRQVSVQVNTSPNAAFVVYRLRTIIQTTAGTGHVTYDDCALDGPVVTCNLTGTVTSRGVPTEGVQVSVAGNSTTTGLAGNYSLDVPIIGDPATQLTATKSGYWNSAVNVSLVSGPLVRDVEIHPLPVNNLLNNPGFEQGVLLYYGSAYWKQLAYGWTYECLQSSGGFENEATAGLYWGTPPMMHSGAAACRMYQIAETAILRASQTIPVEPNSEYTASTWLFTDGEFGLLSDSAGLNVVELDEYGEEIPMLEHSAVVTDGVEEYRYLYTTFTTSDETRYVRYSIDSTLEVPTYYGHATFDDCALEGPEVTCVISGVVASGGVPVEGVTVTAAGHSGVSGADGVYTITMPLGQQPTTIVASKDGYYDSSKSVELVRGDNTVDFEMVPRLYSNLLVNPSFEDGVPLRYDPSPIPFSWEHASWKYDFLTTNCGVEDEATCAWGVQPSYQYHDGVHACRTFGWTHQTPNQINVSQTIRIIPNEEYTAVAWVRAVGTFGQSGQDHADLIVQQLNSAGAVIAGTESRIGVTDSSTEPYRRLMMTVNTHPNAYFARYILETVTDKFYSTGHVTWDDCSFEGPEVNCSLQGVVRSSGLPVQGAVVSVVGGASTVTGPDGSYTMITAIAKEPATIVVSKPGYWDTTKPVVLQAAVANTVDLELIPRANLLANPGWEEGSVFWEIAGPAFYPYDGGTFRGWRTVIPDPVVISGIRNESSAGANWGEPAKFKSGVAALRVYARTDPPNPAGTAHVQDMQTVSVLPNTTYDVGVWVRTVGAFGQIGDFAGFIVEQMDSTGTVIGTNMVGITDGSSNLFRPVNTQITTLPNAASVRYIVVGKISSPYTAGYITFDDCLFGPASVPGLTLGELAQSGVAGYAKGKIVTAAFDGFFYIEEPDRSHGVRVLGSSTPGTVVAVYGKIEDVGGEPTLDPLKVENLLGTAQIAPLGMNMRAAEVGLSAVGLYVTMWGRIDSVGAGAFTMTDGGGASLKVYAPAGFVAEQGDYVTATGALGSEEYGNQVIPVLRAVTVSPVDES